MLNNSGQKIMKHKVLSICILAVLLAGCKEDFSVWKKYNEDWLENVNKPYIESLRDAPVKEGYISAGITASGIQYIIRQDRQTKFTGNGYIRQPSDKRHDSRDSIEKDLNRGKKVLRRMAGDALRPRTERGSQLHHIHSLASGIRQGRAKAGKYIEIFHTSVFGNKVRYDSS